jgi:hypothetical protein
MFTAVPDLELLKFVILMMCVAPFTSVILVNVVALMKLAIMLKFPVLLKYVALLKFVVLRF